MDYLSLCDLVVVPSLAESSTRKEGLPVVILEALSCAKPVVASRCGGIEEVLKDGHNGFLVPAADTAAITNRIKNLFGDRLLLNWMGKSAFYSSEKFDLIYLKNKYKEVLIN